MEPNQTQNTVEDKSIVTPYAFGVHRLLIGKALASPRRRLLAMFLDMVLVSILSALNAAILAGACVWAFWRASRRLAERQRKGIARGMTLLIYSMRVFSATALFILLVPLLGLFQALDSEALINVSEMDISAAEQEALRPILLENSLRMVANRECLESIDCLEPVVAAAATEIGEAGLSVLVLEAALAETLPPLTLALSDEEQEVLRETAMEAHAAAYDPEALETTVTADISESQFTSVIDFIAGILNDLGLGFGWAAFYFTVFTAWWKGQTPAKRLLGMQTVKLDGSELTFWDSFGRYGGYCAGFATGLLGFLQIYWDNNRQCIQDKISETVVIRVSGAGSTIAKTTSLPEQNKEDTEEDTAPANKEAETKNIKGSEFLVSERT